MISMMRYQPGTYHRKRLFSVSVIQSRSVIAVGFDSDFVIWLAKVIMIMIMK